MYGLFSAFEMIGRENFFMKFSCSRQMERITSIHSWSHPTVIYNIILFTSISMKCTHPPTLSLSLAPTLNRLSGRTCNLPFLPFSVYVSFHQRIKTTCSKLFVKLFWLRLFHLLLFFPVDIFGIIELPTEHMH